jgi:glycopeptide antibiotics resistance protein
VGQRVTGWLRTWQTEAAPAGSISRLLLIYTLGYCVYNILPLDLAVHPAEIARKFARGRILLVPFTGYEWNLATAWGLLFDVLLCILIGAWCTGVGTSRRRSLLDAILLGALIVLAVECAQIVVVSRFSETTDVLTGTLGVAIGAFLVQLLSAPALDQRPAASTLRWLSLAILFAAFACLYSWAPFDWIEDPTSIRERLRGFARLPFSAMRSGSDFLAISKILRDALLFLPIGGCLTMALLHSPLGNRRHLCAVLSVALAAILGLLIEFVQAALVGQTSDATDAILYTLGAAIGAFLALVLTRRTAVSPQASTVGAGASQTSTNRPPNASTPASKFN